MTLQSEARLLTPEQVGELWGCSHMTVRRWIAAGRLPIVDIAAPGTKRARIRIREQDAIALVDDLARRPGGEAA